MVCCPSCGHPSGDRFFCDRCRALLPVPGSPALSEHVVLPDGRIVGCAGFLGAFPTDCWEYRAATVGEESVRVYALSPTWWLALHAQVERRAVLALDVLASLEVVRLGEGALVIAHSLPGADCPLLKPPPDEALARVEDTLAACRLLDRVLAPLHDAGLVWLNFDPAGVMVAGERVQVQSLDLVVFPAGAFPDSLSLSRAYSPPEVCAFRGDLIGRATDVFHVALYTYYRLAGLLPHGLPGMGPEACGFDLPPLRIYAPTLPPGIAPVVERGLARDPLDRFATVAEFVSALADAAERAFTRDAERCPVQLEIAGASCIGRTHTQMGLPNQDVYAIVPAGDVCLAIVADGVTLVRIGSGEKASRIGVEVLSRTLPPLLPGLDSFAALHRAISDNCREATQAILDAAMEETTPGEVFDPSEVMSSTLVLAVVRGNELTIASAGDSRAYLIAEGRAEQLTVDGDVRCVHLAAGWPPEEIRDLGSNASALYSCLGVGQFAPDGVLVPDPDRSSPRVRQWRVRPGDVVVLCSDGLVEEGLYLEPQDLARLSAQHDDVQALADALVAAAVALHRPSSPAEPEGTGDDVTCVVLRVRRAQSSTG